MNHIFEQIAAERKRQDEKWGEQNYVLTNVAVNKHKHTADVWRHINEKEESYWKDWYTVLQEKVERVFAETDPVKSREEMIQVAAVAVQIIEYLDRQIDGGKGC